MSQKSKIIVGAYTIVTIAIGMSSVYGMLCLIVLGISATIIFSSDSSKKSEVGNEKNCEEIQLLRERIDNLFTTQNATLSSLYTNNLNVAFHNLLIWIRDNRANYQADNFVSMLVVLANDIRSQVVDLERRQKARLQAEQAEARAKAEAEARAKAEAEAEATRLQDISDLKEEATKLKQQLVGATMVYLSVVALNNNEDTTKAHDELVELRKELEIVSMRMVSLGVSPEEVSINTRDFAQGVSPTDKKIVVPPVPKDQDSDLVEPDVEYLDDINLEQYNFLQVLPSSKEDVVEDEDQETGILFIDQTAGDEPGQVLEEPSEKRENTATQWAVGKSKLTKNELPDEDIEVKE